MFSNFKSLARGMRCALHFELSDEFGFIFISYLNLMTRNHSYLLSSISC